MGRHRFKPLSMTAQADLRPSVHRRPFPTSHVACRQGAAKRGLPVQGRPPEATPRAWGGPTTMRTLAEGAGKRLETGEQAAPQRGGRRRGANSPAPVLARGCQKSYSLAAGTRAPTARGAGESAAAG
jgi:hypothetical protein